jgi:XapX domain-containing protein
MKLIIGLILAIFVGVGCRWFGIPLPGPPAIMGAAMAVAMATGYTATDYWLTKKVPTPSSITASSPAAPVNSPSE